MKEARREKLKNILLMTLAVILAAAMISATFLISGYRAVETNGEMSAEYMNSVKIVYSVETEAEFKNALETYMKRLLDITEGHISMDYLGAGVILNALRNAGIGSDKVQSISKYLRETTPSDEVKKGFLEDILIESKDADGNVEKDANGDIIYVINPDADIAASLAAHINPIEIFMDIVMNTALTSYDVGAFLYEQQLLVSGGEKKLLLLRLGRKNYTALIADTMETANLFSVFMSSADITYSEGRMMRELLYEQGSKYIRILDAFGAEDLELLFGIGEDIIDKSQIKEEDKYIADAINGIMGNLKGMFGYFLYAAGDTLMNLPLAAFDSLVNYLNGNEERDFVYSVLCAAKELYGSHGRAMEFSGLNEIIILDKYASFAANIRVVDGEEKSFDELKAEEIIAGIELFASLKILADTEIGSAADFRNLNEQEYIKIRNNLEKFEKNYKRLENGLKIAETMLIYSLIISTLYSLT